MTAYTDDNLIPAQADPRIASLLALPESRAPDYLVPTRWVGTR